MLGDIDIAWFRCRLQFFSMFQEDEGIRLEHTSTSVRRSSMGFVPESQVRIMTHYHWWRERDSNPRSLRSRTDFRRRPATRPVMI